MVLVFIFCGIVIAITLLICMIILSTLKIELCHFEASNMDNNKEISYSDSYTNKKENSKKHRSMQVSENYQLKISLCLMNKVKWIGVHLNNRKIEKMSRKIKWQKIDFKKMERDFKIEDLKQLKKVKPNVSYFHLESKVGVEDVIITSFLVATISTMISVILPHVVDKYEKNKYHYKIVPLYINKNVYEIKFDGIIEIKMVHIINILYYFLKKRREKNHEQRASNRRAYGYSYE